MLGGRNKKTQRRSTDGIGKMKKRGLVEKPAFIAAVSRVIRTTPLIRDDCQGGAARNQ
jgi:hypothetical protein